MNLTNLESRMADIARKIDAMPIMMAEKLKLFKEKTGGSKAAYYRLLK